MSCTSPGGHADCFIAAAVFLGSSAEQTGAAVGRAGLSALPYEPRDTLAVKSSSGG